VTNSSFTCALRVGPASLTSAISRHPWIMDHVRARFVIRVVCVLCAKQILLPLRPSSQTRASQKNLKKLKRCSLLVRTVPSPASASAVWGCISVRKDGFSHPDSGSRFSTTMTLFHQITLGSHIAFAWKIYGYVCLRDGGVYICIFCLLVCSVVCVCFGLFCVLDDSCAPGSNACLCFCWSEIT
jgi:hypothetical protein